MSKVIKTIGRTAAEKEAKKRAQHRYTVEYEKSFADEAHRYYWTAWLSGFIGHLIGGGAVTIYEMLGEHS